MVHDHPASNATLPSCIVSLVAGGAAGTAVDISLFPLDTIKTRLQAKGGFWQSGGFKGIYSGLFSAAVGSAPTAALFFVSYDSTKRLFNSIVKDNKLEPVGHLLAASVGEISACLLRVPVEVVKQRTQTLGKTSSFATFNYTRKSEGWKGFYRGYLTTVMREVPFSAIQFPLWEFFKNKVSEKTHEPITALQSSICGALSGGISAGLTTPLDVAKTRIILAEKDSKTAKGNIVYVLKDVVKQNGYKGLFAGLGPRVLWISIGGSIFLGVYEKIRISLS